MEGIRDRLVNLHLLRLTKEKNYQLHSLIREFFRAKLSESPFADTYLMNRRVRRVRRGREERDGDLGGALNLGYPSLFPRVLGYHL